MGLTFAVFTAYGVLAGAVRGQVVLAASVVWAPRTLAVAFAALAARLALAER